MNGFLERPTTMICHVFQSFPLCSFTNSFLNSDAPLRCNCLDYFHLVLHCHSFQVPQIPLSIFFCASSFHDLNMSLLLASSDQIGNCSYWRFPLLLQSQATFRSLPHAKASVRSSIVTVISLRKGITRTWCSRSYPSLLTCLLMLVKQYEYCRNDNNSITSSL